MNARTYAKAFVEYAHAHPDADSKELVKRLTEILTRRGHSAFIPGIKKELSRLTSERGERSARLMVAREEDVSKAQAHIEAHKAELELEGSDLTVHIDDTLIGGFVVETKNKVLDASYKRILSELYQKMTA